MIANIVCNSRVAGLTHGWAKRVGRGQLQVCAYSSAKFWVGGNWKCNLDGASVTNLTKEMIKSDIPQDVDVVCAPPFVYLLQVKDMLRGTQIEVSAQNCWTGNGAFTGEVSVDMLADIKIRWVIIGHSERRQYGCESDEMVGDKVAKARSAGLKVIACIGERLEQRESGELWDVLTKQFDAVISNVDDWDNVVIAYEPVWAIGTGVVATPEQAQEVHAFLRKMLTDRVGEKIAQTTRLVYGGSVKPANCKELATQPDIDGFLVGGCSLSSNEFVDIVHAHQ